MQEAAVFPPTLVRVWSMGRKVGLKGNDYRKLMLRCPFCPLLFHDRLQLQQRGQSYRPSRSSNVQWRVCGQTEERAEFPSERVGELLPLAVVEECSPVGRLCKIRTEGHRAHQLLKLLQIPSLKDCQFLAIKLAGSLGFGPPVKSQTNCVFPSSNSKLLPLVINASPFFLAQ